MIKRGLGGLGGLGGGQGGKSPEELEEEAAAELRRAMGGGGGGGQNEYAGARGAGDYRNPYGGQRMPPELDPRPRSRREAPPDDEDEYEYEYEDDEFEPPRRLSIEEERRAITEMAMQQLDERPQARNRSQGAMGVPMAATHAEDMRNRALADMLEKQRRMAKEKPARTRPAIVQKISGANISPSLSVRPTITGWKAPVEIEREEAEARLAAGGDDDGTKADLAFGLSADLTAALRTRKEERLKSAPPRRDDVAASAASRSGSALAPRRGGSPARAQRRAARFTTSAGGPSPVKTAVQGIVGRGQPPESLQRVCRWLADQTDASVVGVVVEGETIVQVAAWPPLSVLARELKHAVRRPMDEASSVRVALNEDRSLASGPDQVLVLPDGSEADGCEWLVAPLAYRQDRYGSFVLTRREGEVFSTTEIDTVDEVAHLMSRLFNGQDLSAPEPPEPEVEDEDTTDLDEEGLNAEEVGVTSAEAEPEAEPAAAVAEATAGITSTGSPEAPPTVEEPSVAAEVETEPPATEPPAAEAVATPATEPPATEPAVASTEPPVTEPAAGEPAATVADATKAADAKGGRRKRKDIVTDAPVTAAPAAAAAAPLAVVSSLPGELFERLAALSFVLGAVGSPAAATLDPERAKLFLEITRDAEALRGRVGELLGLGGSGEG